MVTNSSDRLIRYKVEPPPGSIKYPACGSPGQQCSPADPGRHPGVYGSRHRANRTSEVTGCRSDKHLEGNELGADRPIRSYHPVVTAYPPELDCPEFVGGVEGCLLNCSPGLTRNRGCFSNGGLSDCLRLRDGTCRLFLPPSAKSLIEGNKLRTHAADALS